MEPRPTKITFKIKKDNEDSADSSSPQVDRKNSKIIENSSLAEENEFGDVEDEEVQDFQTPPTQLALYDTAKIDGGEIEPVPLAIDIQIPAYQKCVAPNPSSRGLPSVGAYTVQCADCFKWRLIPTKEKYEEIREQILKEPFVCETACEWQPGVSCEALPDISQDGSRLWAIDRPNIARPPFGWERELKFRAEGSTKFADVYYVAPNGKRLRSMVEVEKYLQKHPEYARRGVTLSQFSFQTPKPLQENYVRKRSRMGLSRPVEPDCVSPPLPLFGPYDISEMQRNQRALPAPSSEALANDTVGQPAKKEVKTSPSETNALQ